MPVPFTFGTATTSIPLSNLDANFNTPVTIGNTTVGLGNTVTTLGNVTLTNTTISSVSAPLSQTNGGTGTTTGYYGFKNRIINGAMVIDQRNAGASVTPTDGSYTLDRWQSRVSAASKFTVQQNAGSVTTPAGFRNYLGVTSSSAYSVVSGDFFTVQQRIEGFNFSDLNWGTSSAQTVTLSFWVRSSLTGTFGGAISNSDFNRSYPFTYSISSANTWEQKSVTIAGDTTGTWVGATNGVGAQLFFSLGAGSTYSGTAGAWAASGLFSATGATSVVGTNGATFYITGVQLEVGSTATSFDYRPYGTELLLCQRYCEVWRFITGTIDRYAIGVGFNDQLIFQCIVQKRAAATVTVTGNAEIRDTTNAQRLIGSVVGATDRSFQFSLTSTPAVAAVGTLRFPTGNTDAVIISSEL